MKRIIIVLCLVIATTLVACGNNEETNVEGNETVIDDTTKNSTDDAEDNVNVMEKVINDFAKKYSNVPTTTTGAKYLFDNVARIYQVPAEKIYVNVPDYNYQEIEQGFTKMFVIGRELNVAITSDDTIKTTTLEQAHKEIFNDYTQNLQNYAKIDELKVKTDETVTINGIEMYKFEGELECHYDTRRYELYTIGYSFVMDGIPCSIEGTVLNETQPQDMIDNVRDTVNVMAQTVRNTK